MLFRSETSDDVNGLDPEISAFLEAGSYEIEVSGYQESAGGFTLSTSS